MSRDKQRPDQTGPNSIGDVIQVSNQTSGYFLGTVPRQWMLNGGDPSAATGSGTRRRSIPKEAHVAVVPQPSLDIDSNATLARPPALGLSEFNSLTTHIPEVREDIIRNVEPPNVPGANANNGAFIANNGCAVAPGRNYAFIDLESFTGLPLPSVASPAPLNTSDNLSPTVLQTTTSTHSVHHSYSQDIIVTGNEPIAGPHTQPQHDQAATASVPPSGASLSHESTVLDHWSSSTDSISHTSMMHPQNQPSPAQGQVNSGVSSDIQPSPAPAPPLRQLLPSSSCDNLLDPPSTAPRTNLLQMLNVKVTTFPATLSLTIYETSRITWLRLACERADVFYLLLHQFVCVHVVQPQILIRDLFCDSDHAAGLSLMNHILSHDRQISRELVELLSEFAVPSVLLSSDSYVQASLPNLKTFLVNLVPQWHILKTSVIARNFPPSAAEIAIRLGIDGSVLLLAVHSYFLHHLFPMASHSFLFNAVQLFKLSHRVFQKTMQDSGTSVMSGAWLDNEVKQFADKFKKITIRYHQQPATSSQIGNGQALPSAGRTRSNPHEFTSQSPTASMPARPIPPRPPVDPSDTTQDGSRLFPSQGQFLPLTANPNPARIALHQVHLSSPAIQLPAGEKVRIYSFLDRVVGEPKLINNATVYEAWTVQIPPDIFERRLQTKRAGKDNLFGKPLRLARNWSVIFYLRCVQIPAMDFVLDDAVHSTSATYWPEHMFISINGTHLEFRRKVHHGKDHPVDVTEFLEQDLNEIIVSYSANRAEAGNFFAIVVEAITTLDHSEASKLPSPIDAQASLAAIMLPFRNQTEDDDVIMADEHISIDLIDPITARLVDRPVRGRTCRHRECFDLEAFLQSRSCRNKNNFVHSEEWKCPLCGKDARPPSLIIDHFLLQVRDKLMAESNSDVKAILVKPDGNWEPKVVAATTPADCSARESKEPETTRSPTAVSDVKLISGTAMQRHTSPTTTNEPVIIELFDDNSD